MTVGQIPADAHMNSVRGFKTPNHWVVVRPDGLTHKKGNIDIDRGGGGGVYVQGYFSLPEIPSICQRCNNPNEIRYFQVTLQSLYVFPICHPAGA